VTHTFSQQKDDFFSQQNRRAEDKTLCPEGRGLVDANGQLVLVPGPIFFDFLVTRFFISAKSAEKMELLYLENLWKIFGRYGNIIGQSINGSVTFGKS